MLETAESLAQGAAKASVQQAGRAERTRSARRTAATRSAARSRQHPICSTAASTGKGRIVDPNGPNILIDLPPAIRNFPAYVASGIRPDEPGRAEHPGRRLSTRTSSSVTQPAPSSTRCGSSYSDSFWEVTACQWQERFDPTYRHVRRRARQLRLPGASRRRPASSRRSRPWTTTGKIKKPLITVAGTMDSLLPIKRAGARVRGRRQRVAQGQQ